MEDRRWGWGTKGQAKSGNKTQRSLRLSGKNQVDRRGAEGAEGRPRAKRGPTEVGVKDKVRLRGQTLIQRPTLIFYGIRFGV